MNARATATFESVGSILTAHKGELAKGFGVSEIGVFGSVASGTAKEESDVDILVSFSRPVGFISFMRLERRLQELLGLSLIHISEPTRLGMISYAVFCLK